MIKGGRLTSQVVQEWLEELINPWILKPAYALSWLRRGKQIQDDSKS